MVAGSSKPSIEALSFSTSIFEHGVQIQGASDHTVTHSLYIADPDGHEIELYVDVIATEEWLADPSLVFAPIRPLHL